MSSQAASKTARVVGWSTSAARRLAEAIERHGARSTVAELAGISRQALSEILGGNSTPKVGTLESLCDVIGVDFNFIMKGFAGDDASPANRSINIASNYLAIPEADLSYGMGGTFVDDISTSTVIRELPAEWVRSFTHAPAEQLFLCRGIGDSMMPTLLDSDLLLVDRSQTRLKQSDRIWVVMIGDIGMIKRLRVEPTGNLTLLADNETVPPMTVGVEEIVPIGRVVAVIRKM